MTKLNQKITAMAFAVLASFSFLVALPASAGDTVILDAKNAQQVGEQLDGYLGLIINDASPELIRAVRETNIGRKAIYGDLARASGTSINQVAALTAEKTIAKVLAGQKYMNAEGQWVAK
ncbi:MAG: hypothetical protein COA47_08415 [Robiginitomaculum sp.]|nr:MAG: hypothetical protein COA47_08415 [Robiginitomaculum sp.]